MAEETPTTTTAEEEAATTPAEEVVVPIKYQLLEGMNVKTIYNILAHRENKAFKSYDKKYYYFYDLQAEENIPIFLGLIVSDPEILYDLFSLERGMYGVAGRKVLVMLIELMQEHPDFVLYVRDVNTRRLNGSQKNGNKILLWILAAKLKSLLAQEDSESFNVRLCCSKIQRVMSYLGSGDTTTAVLANCGKLLHANDWFRMHDVFGTLVREPLAGLVDSNEAFVEFENEDVMDGPVGMFLS